MDSERREARTNAGFVVLALIVILGLAVGGAAAADLGPFDDAPERKPFGACAGYVFDRSAWNETDNPNRSDFDDPGDLSPAQLHARQLVNCDLLLGKTRAAIRRQLGEPTSRDPEWFSYDVGLAPDTFFLERETLNLRFDDSGHADLVKLHA